MPTDEEKRRGPAGGRERRSWDYPEPPPSRSSKGAGWGLLLLVGLIGAVIGGFIGLYTAPPQTEYYGPDYGADVSRLFVSAIVGFLIGLLVGYAILWIRNAVARRSR